MSARYSGKVDVRIYQAGKDVEYVAKYGPVMRGTLFIGERIRIERLSRAIIEQAITDALAGVEA